MQGRSVTVVDIPDKIQGKGGQAALDFET